MDKIRIQTSFDKAVSFYESVSDIQKHCASFLVNHLRENFPLFYPASILDLGSGTGYIPELLLPFFPESSYTVNDLSPGMIKKNQEKFANCKRFTFCVGDMENTSFPYHSLVISNFALQWAMALKKTLKKYYYQSEIFAFSLLIAGTFEEWEKLLYQYQLPSPLYSYPSAEEIQTFITSLTSRQAIVKTEKFSLSFEHPKAFIAYLRQLGAVSGQDSLPFSLFKQFIKEYRKTVDVTYHVLFALLKRI
jgi:malonyl-CoA O-methyltransferase